MFFFKIEKVGNSDIVHDNIPGLKWKFDVDSFEFILESADDNKEGLFNGRSKQKTKGLLLLVLLDFVSNFCFLFGHVFKKLFE